MDFDISGELDDESLQMLFAWIDSVPLSRRKRNITRDFSDGLLVAEIVKYYFPKYVDIHNYASANSVVQKLSNWDVLKRKVLPKLNYFVPVDVPRNISECVTGVAEMFLFGLMQKIQTHLIKTKSQKSIMLSRPTLYESNMSKPKFEAASTRPHHSECVSTSHNQTNAKSSLNTLDGPLMDSQTRLLLAEREETMIALQETVQMLQAKVHRLEHLLHIKDLRLRDLQQATTDSDFIAPLPQYSELP